MKSKKLLNLFSNWYLFTVQRIQMITLKLNTVIYNCFLFSKEIYFIFESINFIPYELIKNNKLLKHMSRLFSNWYLITVQRIRMITLKVNTVISNWLSTFKTFPISNFFLRSCILRLALLYDASLSNNKYIMTFVVGKWTITAYSPGITAVSETSSTCMREVTNRMTEKHPTMCI